MAVTEGYQSLLRGGGIGDLGVVVMHVCQVNGCSADVATCAYTFAVRLPLFYWVWTMKCF